jgi:hypothetical protein
MSTTSNDTSKTSETPSSETSQEQEELSPQLDAFLNELASMAAMRAVLTQIEDEHYQRHPEETPENWEQIRSAGMRGRPRKLI